jgi:ADP-ribosylglycohydrolase
MAAEALLQAATTAQGSSAAVALCGALAGAHYGIDSFPADWRRRLAEEAPLRSLARDLLG